MSEESQEKPKPQAQPLDPDTKLIRIKKTKGKGWEISFKGPVKRLDVNHVTRLLRIQYNRVKRQQRLESRKASRQSEETQGVRQ